MRWSEALGHEVVDTSTAEAVGRVDALVLDPQDSSITAFVVGDRVVSWSDTGGIGSDAVTISGSELLRAPRTGTEEGAVDGSSRPLSKPILTEDGYALGELNDIEVDPVTGSVQLLITDDDEIAGSRLMGAGSFAVIVSSASRTSSDGDPDALTKTELYELAKDRDIDGRSNMTKDQLLDALG